MSSRFPAPNRFQPSSIWAHKRVCVCVRMCVYVFFLVLKHGRTMMRPSRCDTIAVQCAVLPETCCIRRARCVRWASGAALIRAQHYNKMQRPLRSPNAPTWHKPFRRDNKVATTRSHDFVVHKFEIRASAIQITERDFSAAWILQWLQHHVAQTIPSRQQGCNNPIT